MLSGGIAALQDKRNFDKSKVNIFFKFYYKKSYWLFSSKKVIIFYYLMFNNIAS